MSVTIAENLFKVRDRGHNETKRTLAAKALIRRCGVVTSMLTCLLNIQDGSQEPEVENCMYSSSCLHNCSVKSSSSSNFL